MNGYDLLFALPVLRGQFYQREALHLLKPVYGLPSSRRERLQVIRERPSYHQVGPDLATTPDSGPTVNLTLAIVKNKVQTVVTVVNSKTYYH